MRRSIAQGLPLLALLAGGCIASSSPPARTPIGGTPSSPAVQTQTPAAGHTTNYPATGGETPVRLASYQTAAAAPAAAKPSWLQLPSLKLATDGPILNMLRPSNDLNWSPDQAVLPSAEFHGDQVAVHNIRNSTYRTIDDYTVRHYDKTFELRHRHCRGVDRLPVRVVDLGGVE